GGVGLAGMLRIQRLNADFASAALEEATLVSRLIQTVDDVRRLEKDMVINYELSDKVKVLQAQWQKKFGDAQATTEALLAREDGPVKNLVRQLWPKLEAYQKLAAPVIQTTANGSYDTATIANRMLGKAAEQAQAAEALLAELGKAQAAESQKAQADAAVQVRNTTVMFGALLLVAVLVVVPTTLANMVSICAPIDRARALAERIATGDLSNDVDANGSDEAAQLLRALGDMQESLRRIVGQVRGASDQIQVASAEVAAGNQDLSQRTEQAAANLQQTAGSLEQLTGTVRQSADAAAQANQLAASASTVAKRGGDVVAQVVSTMDDINTSSKKISDIIGVIDGIAFQTNILALNAAVEAARAGEQGRGFAVVAGEVRSLAGRSAEAAREIKSLISTSVEKVETGSRLVGDAGSTMREIVDSVQRVTDIIGEISAAATEQSSGIGQVNGSVVQLDQMTQQNAALVEQSAAAAESLRDQAGRLAGAVASFRLSDTAGAAAVAFVAPRKPEARAKAAPVKAVASVKPVAAKPVTVQPTAAKRAPAKSAAPVKAAPASKPAAATTAEGDWESF
ncbi:MAG: HAMP domain-containing protein, partial [Burkholderiales bacterium]|nr:HAMP domain-containing protein [Burkholderiales bacterium]